MQQRAYCAAHISRRAFKELVILWLTIVFVTFTAALILSTSRSAHADILYMPITQLEKVGVPANITTFTQVPKPVTVDVRCQQLLNPIQGSIPQHISAHDRDRRAAGNSAAIAIAAIRSYRLCSKEATLGSMTTALIK